MRMSGLLSEVATTSTLRDMPSGPRSRSMNSTTSRPRSPTRPMTLTSALVYRAIMPSVVDLPTPEPAMMPTRWPLPRVSRPLTERMPTSRGSLMRGRSRGLGGSRCRGGVVVGQDGPLAVQGLAKGVHGPAEQFKAHRDMGRGGRVLYERTGADAAHVRIGHEQAGAVAEADHLGRDRFVVGRQQIADRAERGLDAVSLGDESDHLGDLAEGLAGVEFLEQAEWGIERHELPLVVGRDLFGQLVENGFNAFPSGAHGVVHPAPGALHYDAAGLYGCVGLDGPVFESGGRGPGWP